MLLTLVLVRVAALALLMGGCAAGAAYRHGMHIPDTRRRVRRTASHAFEHGGMVGKIRYGYRKLTPEEADSGTFGPKGLRLARVPDKLDQVAYVRFASVYRQFEDATQFRDIVNVLRKTERVKRN